MSLHSIAPDDIVVTHEDAVGNPRPPLLVLEPLGDFLDAHGLGSGEIEASPIGDGHSNVTYALRRGNTEMVLRRPPRGPLPPSAHDVLREARVIAALARRAAVPAVLAVCEDESVIGAPFYVMEKMDGVVLSNTVPAHLDTPSERRRVGEELVDALADLHAVDWRACGLEGFGRPDGYLERQLRRFTGLWEHNRTREIPAFDRVTEWLGKNLPESPPATIVHGDYRVGNVMYAGSAPARLIAIFDWEMATIGDPLADVGYLCIAYVDRDDPPGPFEHFSLTRAQGFPSRGELTERYAERSGRALNDLQWYQVLAAWKSVVFMEGNFRRTLTGASDDPFVKNFSEGVLRLADYAEQIAFGKALA
jgi:aminoglycoside phosphotransferase (APT) family kinase protein